ncbi:acyl-CoA dehydrogenase fadE12 [Variibacter gotjawalensis]|uniref:Acyl-CoA dehydrogenase fadE12 n=1 Tax=Variibacter gotjawalensis TaxID=1333996 RepID=A0A0S3PRG5_9BRAD|nr:acyl-CoA dehydrogenase family protein [Variibacter gotjawalensis]NIK48842.1 acyl-CoA dehydrogenase [Variibacter gotjawalensis]RZS50702.1 acyl-CoA dehydrogenase [Variibacter gotjawalensis]BAT58536.1 acyl-CoA dehydrogenase fadE12 [Variibacter gotjawalensis]
MDFDLTHEQRQILDYGDAIAQKFDRKYWMEHAEKREFPKGLYDQVARDGFVGTMVPEEYGGSGQGMLEMHLFLEGLSNNGIPLLNLVVGAAMSLGFIAKHGTEDQKKRFLPDACAGKTRFCFAITESDAGSNTIQTKTIAKRRGNRFALSGAKTFITDADGSDYALVVARTTPHTEVQRKTEGFTLFVVDLKSKGVERQYIPVSIPAPETQWQIFFDDVDLGPDDVVGEVDKGFGILFKSLNPERILVASICCGLGRYALNRAVTYANERKVFKDTPIGAYQGVQHPLANARTQVEMASLMALKAAWIFDQGREAGEFANMAKLAAADAGIAAVDAALQTHGGNGFTKEYGIFDLYPLVRLLKTAPLNREMILNYIGEHVMGLPRSY